MNSYPAFIKDILASDDFITSDKFLHFARQNTIPYYKRDLLYSGGEWRDQYMKSIFSDTLNNFRQSLLIGHSDKKVNRYDLFLLRGLGIKHIWGTNTLNKKEFSTSIPLGLTNNSNESDLYNLLGDTSHFLRAHEFSSVLSDFSGKVYVNFSNKTNFTIRENLSKIVKNMKNITYGDMILSNKGRIQYLKDLRTNAFVLCPEGNGIDTHRVWETLYMGGIPIIIKSKYLPKILNELPVLQLNNWNEILDITFLEAQWYKIRNLSTNYSKIQMKYWYEILKNGPNNRI